MIIKLLQAIASLTRTGAIKSVDDAYRLAKRELGEKFNTYKKQIKDAFDSGSQKKKPDNVIPFPKKKKEGIETLPKYKDIAKGDSDLINEINEIKKGLGEIKNETNLLPDSERLAKGFPNRSVEAIVRAGARQLLSKKGIEVGKQDPIDVARQIFGDEVLYALDNAADELMQARTFDQMQTILDEKNISGMKPREGLDVSKTEEIEEITKFDETDRKPNSQGGINVSEDIVTLMDKVMAKRKADKQESKAKQQKRYRDLIASKKFPELELFFREKLTTDRVNAQAGGAFTAPQLQQRANQSYLDYLARQNRPVTNIFQPGKTNYPTVNFSNVDLNATSPSSPAAGSGTGGTSSGNVGTGGGNYQPNTGMTGGGTGISVGGSGGGTTVVNKETEETIDLTPPTSGGSGGGSGTSGGATGAEALAAYQEYLSNFSGGTPLSFESFRMGTPYAGQLTFTSDDFMTLQGLKDQVANYDQTGKLDLGGYTGPDPRGTTDSFQYKEDMTANTSSSAFDPNRIETFEEKRKREEAEAAAKKEQEEGGGADNFPELNNYQTNQETVSDIQKSAQGLNLSNEADYDQFMRAQSNQTIGSDDKGNKITMGDVVKFVGKTAARLVLTGQPFEVESIIKTAVTNKAKQMVGDKIKDTIGSTGDDVIPGIAGNVDLSLSNNLIGSNNAMSFSKGGRVKLFTGTVPGFTQQELEERRKLSQRDFAARQGQAPTSSNVAPVVNTPGINIPGTNTPISTPVNTGSSPALGGPTPVGGQPGGPTPSNTQTTANAASGMSTPSNLKSVSEINKMDPFQYDQYMKSLAPSEAKQVEQMLMNQGPMMIGSGEGGGGMIPQNADPMNLLKDVGISQSDYDNMTMDQQDDVFAGIAYLQQYGSSPTTQAMILSERGIDPKQYLRSDGTYDKLALGKAKLQSDIQEGIDDGYLPGVTLTGNESFAELAELDRKYYNAILASGSGSTYTVPSGASSAQGMQMMNEQKRQMDAIKAQGTGIGLGSQYAKGGRVGYKFGSKLKTKDPKVKVKVSNEHQQLLNLLKQKQSKQLMKGLKNVIANKKKIQDKSPEQIKKAMDRLAQLKKFYGRA